MLWKRFGIRKVKPLIVYNNPQNSNFPKVVKNGPDHNKEMVRLDRRLIYLSNDTKFMEFGSAVLEISFKNQLVDLSHFHLQKLISY